MDFFYLYLGLGWVAVSVAAAVLMGRFIAAGKGDLSSPPAEDVAQPEVPARPLTVADTRQDDNKQQAA